jgi:hypothetical protein
MLAPNMPSGPQKGRVVTLVTVYAHHDFAPASDMAGAFHCGSHCCNTRRCQLDTRRAFHSLRPVGLERTTVRLPKKIGTRIDAVLQGKEKRSDLIRRGILREIERREAEKGPKKKSR